jgi:hypothetical protein
MTDTTTECIGEIREFIQSVKREIYSDNSKNTHMSLYLESSDIFDKSIYTNTYKNARIWYNKKETTLLKCPLQSKNSIQSVNIINELKKDNNIEEHYHIYKYIDNEFMHNGKWYFYSINVNISFKDKMKFFKEDIFNKN